MIWTASELSILKSGFAEMFSDREIAASLVARGHAFRTSNAIMKMRNVLGLRRNTNLHGGKGRPMKEPHIEIDSPSYWMMARENDAKWDAAMAAEGITKRFTVTEPGTRHPVFVKVGRVYGSPGGFTYPASCDW